jgi:hypothetical protein
VTEATSWCSRCGTPKSPRGPSWPHASDQRSARPGCPSRPGLRGCPSWGGTTPTERATGPSCPGSEIRAQHPGRVFKDLVGALVPLEELGGSTNLLRRATCGPHDDDRGGSLRRRAGSAGNGVLLVLRRKGQTSVPAAAALLLVPMERTASAAQIGLPRFGLATLPEAYLAGFGGTLQRRSAVSWSVIRQLLPVSTFHLIVSAHACRY